MLASVIARLHATQDAHLQRVWARQLVCVVVMAITLFIHDITRIVTSQQFGNPPVNAQGRFAGLSRAARNGEARVFDCRHSTLTFGRARGSALTLFTPHLGPRPHRVLQERHDMAVWRTQGHLVLEPRRFELQSPSVYSHARRNRLWGAIGIRDKTLSPTRPEDIRRPDTLGRLAITWLVWPMRSALKIFPGRPSQGEHEMDMVKSTELAHALYRTHGNKAELEAAQKENRFKSEGNDGEAMRWRAIRQSIRRMRGANQS